MHEIWLTLNIPFELSLKYRPAVIGSLTLWLVLITMAAARGRAGWRKALGPAIAIGIVVTAITFFVTPGLTQSSFANMGRWVASGNLFLYAAAFGAVGAALAWPIVAMRRRT